MPPTTRAVASPATRLLAMLDADAAFVAAGEVAMARLREFLLPGMRVAWSVGGSARHGVIVQPIGFQYHNMSVRVKSDISGKVYDVDAHWIIESFRYERNMRALADAPRPTP